MPDPEERIGHRVEQRVGEGESSGFLAAAIHLRETMSKIATAATPARVKWMKS